MTILISDKLKSIAEIKGSFHNNKGPKHQEDIIILNVCTPNNKL